jgi:hypothetical protein
VASQIEGFGRRSQVKALDLTCDMFPNQAVLLQHCFSLDVDTPFTVTFQQYSICWLSTCRCF